MLDNDVKPPKEEYLQLKDLDTRLHGLKFSTAIAKKYSGFKRGDSVTLSLNRYAWSKVIQRPYFNEYIALTSTHL